MTPEIITPVEAKPKNLQREFSTNIRDHFPFDVVRHAQELGLRTVERALENKKKFVVIEAPTGVGKSGIAIASASHAKVALTDDKEEGAHILSPQKTLTKQYLNDFGDRGLVELKGKSNYYCAEHDTDCDTGAILNKSSNKGDDRKVCADCPYKLAKQIYIDSPMGVTSNAYFLNETQYAGQIPHRELLVLDEGHNTEGQVLGFADTTITRFRMDEIGLGAVPFFSPGDTIKVYDWCHRDFLPACQRFMSYLENEVKSAKLYHKKDEAVAYSKRLDNYDKFVCRLNRFLNSSNLNDWLCYTTEANKRGEAELLIKPLTAVLFADEILFQKASRVLIMSATILDFRTFLRNLGIQPSQAELMAVPSEFPVANRPIFFRPVGHMNYKEKADTLPMMVRYIEKILDKYATQKGIIHTHSYDINNTLVTYLKDTKHKHRIITHSGVQGSRDVALANHLESPEPTILISPSMTEGLDLKEDLSRLQIICKVPYPYMDPYVKARMQRDAAWYQWLTALTLVQATGRSIRSMTDKAHTFILDSDFERFLRTNVNVLPKWWVDSIRTN